jgi:hypothetical protein
MIQEIIGIKTITAQGLIITMRQKMYKFKKYALRSPSAPFLPIILFLLQYSMVCATTTVLLRGLLSESMKLTISTLPIDGDHYVLGLLALIFSVWDYLHSQSESEGSNLRRGNWWANSVATTITNEATQPAIYDCFLGKQGQNESSGFLLFVLLRAFGLASVAQTLSIRSNFLGGLSVRLSTGLSIGLFLHTRSLLPVPFKLCIWSALASREHCGNKILSKQVVSRFCGHKV